MTILTEQQEWDELLASVPLDMPTRDAANRIADLLTDAIQAQRPWARQRLLRGWQVGGVRRETGGEVAYVQVPLDLMSPDELGRYRAMHVSNLKTLAENAKVVERLIDLLEKCPTARNAAEACQQLGLDVADVMAGAA